MQPETAAETLVLTREFDAPRDLVWRVWTEPRHIRQWWGPAHFTSPHVTVDLRPGGRFHFAMRDPEGKDFWSVGEFVEIVPPERIVWLMYFSDARGRRLTPVEYGLGPDYPSEIHDVITFDALGPDRTRLTLRRNTPLAISRSYGEDQGWNQSLDKFAAELARAAKA